MGKLLALAVVGVLAALIGSRIMRLRQVFLPRELEQVEPPNCRLIEGIETGSEDIDILPNGLAFISTGLVYPGMVSFAPDKHGEILLLDLNEDDSKPIILRISRGFDMDSFNPHGISLYVDEKDDEVYLFVVNHPNIATTVEIFKFQEEENALLHLKTIQHELLQSANDVFAVGPDSFYATNDHYFQNEIGRQAELFLDLGWTNVVYYSPSEAKEVAAGFSMANGIAMSPDSKYVYVADCIGRSIHVFEKHANWTVTPVKVLLLNTIVDNLSVDPVTGDVWAGCHPNPAKLQFYDPENPPGSEVIRVQNILSENPVITQVYVNDGSVLQASTIACVHSRNLLVGTIFHKALRCDLD